MVTKATGVIADTICCSTGAYKHVKHIFYYKLFRIYQDYKKTVTDKPKARSKRDLQRRKMFKQRSTVSESGSKQT